MVTVVIGLSHPREEDELNGECAVLCGNSESEGWRVVAFSLR